MPGHIHHSVTQSRSGKHPHGCYCHNGPVLCNPRPDGRVQEVHRVVAYAHYKVEHCEHDKKYYYS